MLRAVWTFYTRYGTPFILLASLLLFFIAHEVEDAHQATFSIVAARESWDVGKKAALCRRVAWCYLLLSFLGLLGGLQGRYIQWWRRVIQRLVCSLKRWWKRVGFRCLLGHVGCRGMRDAMAAPAMWWQQIRKWVRWRRNGTVGDHRGRTYSPPPSRPCSSTSLGTEKKGGSRDSRSLSSRSEVWSRARSTMPYIYSGNSSMYPCSDAYSSDKSPFLHSFEKKEVLQGTSLQTTCPPLPPWREKGGRQWQNWHQSLETDSMDGTAQYPPYTAKMSERSYDDSFSVV